MIKVLLERWNSSKHYWELVPLKRFCGLFVCFCVRLTISNYVTPDAGPRRFVRKNIYNDLDYCDGELMAYSHQSYFDGKYKFQRGRKFHCDLTHYIDMFKLRDTDAVVEQEPNFPNDTAIVIAANNLYWEASRAAIAEVRRHFGNDTKIIFYDLGNVTQRHKEEMDSICTFEYRIFNMSRLPENVRHLKTFAWKVFILAEVFREYNHIMYMDSSIYVETSNFSIFFYMMFNKTLSPVQLSGYTGHGLKFATAPNMYKYLPLDVNVDNKAWMMEANLILLRRTKETRTLLKWAVLCAVAKDCINPSGYFLGCPVPDEGEFNGRCHRQDQSIFNVLVYNMEYDMKRRGHKVIPHMREDHPKNTKQRHETRRLQGTDQNIAQCSAPKI
ncbi:unnamed protein product [Bursaphelenchus okinawaensis]|uniref:Uncharacterized protein n=1 Tax=Bursaphelenchus okinawaensis TaxID=465554 RepID=A0A811KXQ7_9BILA|nr:unnamed protein product [Bursaphelenchus okinawaensis]CAG9113961.1 unnamed protein product [Bursaphelenchus okinawaensis]